MEQTNFKKTIFVFAVIHIILFLGVLPALALKYGFSPCAWENYSAQLMLDHHHIPYHPFVPGFEYPPLALLSFLLPGLITTAMPAYVWIFAIEMLIFDLLALWMLADLASIFKTSVTSILTVYTLVLLAVGPILAGRYDLLPAMLTLAAVWAFVKGKNKLAWAVAALGFAAKLYPIIIIPLFFIYQVKNRQYRRIIEGGAAFLATLLVLFLPWIIIDAGGFCHSFTYHFDRPLHAESTYGTVLLTGQVLGMTKVGAALTYGSWNLFSPLAESLATISFPVTAVAMVIVYGLFTWRLRHDRDGSPAGTMSEISTTNLIQCTVLIVTVFMLTNKVFSAQYMAWLCPLIPLVARGKQYTVPALFMVAAIMTQYVYPYNYIEFELGQALPVTILLLRNLILVLMAVMIALDNRNLYQSPGTRALRSGG
jgi:uncharacterized membrane protein